MMAKGSHFPEDVMIRYMELRTTYGERDSDIYVSSYPRSGTTWMQMILYQLTTEGNMDFDHIGDVSPWLYYSARWCTIPACPPEPRILKTHSDYNFYSPNTKGRFIYVIRDGKDAIVSLYHLRRYEQGYMGTFEKHFEERVNNDEDNWFEHVRGWVENKNSFPILYVKYESLKNDFDNELKRIVDFCDIPVNDSILRRTKERTSFSFMKKYFLQLEYPLQLRAKPAHSQSTKKIKDPFAFFRSGSIGEGKLKLTNKQKDMFSKKFHETLGHFDLVSEYGE
jgi:hypothetical protein